jgi:hypothetical protein
MIGAFLSRIVFKYASGDSQALKNGVERSRLARISHTGFLRREKEG